MDSGQVFLLLATVPLGALVLFLGFGMLMVRLSDGWKSGDPDMVPGALKAPTAARHQIKGSDR